MHCQLRPWTDKCFQALVVRNGAWRDLRRSILRSRLLVSGEYLMPTQGCASRIRRCFRSSTNKTISNHPPKIPRLEWTAFTTVLSKRTSPNGAQCSSVYPILKHGDPTIQGPLPPENSGILCGQNGRSADSWEDLAHLHPPR